MQQLRLESVDQKSAHARLPPGQARRQRLAADLQVNINLPGVVHVTLCQILPSLKTVSTFAGMNPAIYSLTSFVAEP
jgi:hypothetical protein